MKQMRVVVGEIAKLPCECFVSLAKKSSTGKIEPDNNVIKLTGFELLDEFKKFKTFDVGEARLTKGYSSQTKHIIHIIAPTAPNMDGEVEEQLNRCYVNILNLVRDESIKSIAFPIIKIGETKNDFSESIHIAVQSVREWIEKNKSDVEIVFCADTKEEFELCQIFYPLCSWDSEKKYENAVMDIIECIGNTTCLDSREKALAVVKDMLIKARESKKEKVIQAYQRLNYELETVTDTEYDLLYNQCQGRLVAPTKVRCETFEIGAIRYAFGNKIDYLTVDRISTFFNITELDAVTVINNLIKMNYVKIKDYENDGTITYSILIREEEFYLIHGK